MSFQNEGIWAKKGAGLNNGEMTYDTSSRVDPKRSNQWFMDGTETDLFPNKKQAVGVPATNFFSGILNSNDSPWGNASGFTSISGQFAERFFNTETARAVNFDDRSFSSGNTEKALMGRKVNEDLFTSDPSFGLSMSHTLEDPRSGLNFGGIRTVKVSEVKDSDNIMSASMGYVFNRVDNKSVSTDHAYNKVEDGIMSMGFPYNKGDSIGDTYERENNLFTSMGQSHSKIEDNSAITMRNTFDKGDNNFMSMCQTYIGADNSSVTVGQTYSKGNDSAISITHNYKGDSYNLSVGPFYSRGESTIISFGGYNDYDTNPSGSIISSYNFLMGQSLVQRSNAPSAKELVQTNNIIASGAEVSRKKDEPKTSKKAASNNFPSNVKSLLSTGMLDGVPVKYIAWSQEKELCGVIKSSGYQCGCQTCNSSKVINAYEFEQHAGCKTKHPNNHIYFENGKTIYGIVQELRSTPQNMLFDVIQTITGSPINQKCFRLWKGATVELQRIYGKDEMKQLP
ncbi:auxin-induced protein 5NG4-like [Hibiscus syriacus]|uniref:Auxin-induced protein 5NG4-like n=1 Tax=Hibiscus syriacus TaxID=106335 RepID=A0A6A2XUV6_HIBSY|nr:auxin-induced protein 5NG4-like [Hibiscus syriacus]